jgi:hypothetical protein
MKKVFMIMFLAFAGGLFFNDAFHYYREEKYTSCGFAIMLFISMIALIVKQTLV